MAELCFNDWAGVRRVPVEIVGETPKKLRVRLLAATRLPGRRLGQVGAIVLVPKTAVRR